MKIKKCFSSLDFIKNYYFVDDNGVSFEINKEDITDNQLAEYKNKYFFNDGSKIFELLLGDSKDTIKGNFYKFLLLDFNKTPYNSRIEIQELLSQLANGGDFIELKGIVVFIYYQDLDIDFESIMQSINYDFYTTIHMFESGKIYLDLPYSAREGFRILFNLCYTQCFKCGNLKSFYQFSTISDLVLLLVNHDFKQIELLRPIILNRVAYDSQLESICITFFENSLNVSKTAVAIYMHRNTLNNKIDFIRSETGFNITKFKDAMAMYWLLKAK